MAKTFVIINPVSGKRRLDKEQWEEPVRINFPDATIAFTQRPRHATELAAQAVNDGYERILVAGGDGTINEAARALVGKKSAALGIIPKGSGNGLARELGISLHYEEALLSMQRAEPVACDVGQVNNDYFFNVAGIGVEAEIARQFAEHGKTGERGMWPYFQLGLDIVLGYEPKTLTLSYDGQKEQLAPLTLVFANGTQYGSNFTIAPYASITDGFLDSVEVKNVSKWKLALAAPSFFRKAPAAFGVTHMRRTEMAVVSAPGEIVYHLDGEPKVTRGKLYIKILPQALNVLLPKGH